MLDDYIVSDGFNACVAEPVEPYEDENSHIVSEKLKALSISVREFENRGMLRYEVKNLFISCQKDLRSQKQSEMKQTDTRNFFS